MNTIITTPTITDILALAAMPVCAVLFIYGAVIIYRASRASRRRTTSSWRHRQAVEAYRHKLHEDCPRGRN